jgi:hypothetical protein
VTGPNSTAIAAMGADVVRPVYLAFLDIVGDPIRVTTAPYSISFSAGQTGDPDLDGYTFSAIDPEFVSVSAINRKEGGTSTVTVTLSGLKGVDDTLMTQIGNKANWQGRVMRLWQMRFDASLALIGNIWPSHTSYMTVPKIIGGRDSQTIVLDTESYLAFLTEPSNRSYLNQSDYDSGDLSAAASIACANDQTAAGATITNTDVYGGRGQTGKPIFL